MDEWRGFAPDPTRTAILMDFDGTLSAIVDHPDDAVALPGVAEVIARLTTLVARVGIVSGRPVEFLRHAVPVENLAIVGQYGLERWEGGRVVVDPRAQQYAAPIEAVADAADAELPGVFVERKGTVAVTLHWRTTPGLGDRARAWADVAAPARGLQIYPTKMAVELRPPLPVDKGNGVELLATGMGAALFAGDDHGDLSGFDALDRMTANGTLAEALRVGVRSPEEPAELIARADVLVDGPRGFLAWLTDFADALSARS